MPNTSIRRSVFLLCAAAWGVIATGCATQADVDKTIKQAIAPIEANVTDLTSRSDALEKRAAAIEQQIAVLPGIENQLETINQNIEKLLVRLTTAEALLVEQGGKLSALTKGQEALAAESRRLDKGLTGVSDRISNIELVSTKEITLLKKRLEDMETTTTRLMDQLKAAETHITKVTSDTKQTQNSLADARVALGKRIGQNHHVLISILEAEYIATRSRVDQLKALIDSIKPDLVPAPGGRGSSREPNASARGG